MDKLSYLKKSFSHTVGKTFENYVITQIWSKVKDLGLYPVTQQYVKRPNGYALIDLYFPQINFAIEVDELPYHDNNIESDKMRMEDIFNSVSDITIERVREENYESVENQINNVINKIKDIVNGRQFYWTDDWQEKEYKDKLAEVYKNKVLKVSDSIRFKRIQVMNDIFKKNMSEGYLKFGKSYFKLQDNIFIWFPHLTPNKDWQNTVSDDWSTIHQKYIGNKDLTMTVRNELKYTFAKYKDSLGFISFRFIGVFKTEKIVDNICIHKKVSDEIILP